MNRFQRAFRATVVDSGFAYGSQALSFFSLPLFLSTLGAEGYGLMVTVLAFTGYLNFADAGMSWGSMVLISHAHGRKDPVEIAHIVRHSAVLAAASGLVAAGMLVAIFGASAAGWRLPMFARHPEADVLILISGLQLILTLQFGVFYNVFKGLQENYWPAFYQGAGRILGLSGGMAAALLTRNVTWVLLAQFLATALCGSVAALHAWRQHPWAFARGKWTDWGQYGIQARVGGKTFLIQIGQTLAATAPTFGISAILGTGSVPLYTAPVTLLSLFFTPINSWASSMQNAYGEAWASGAVDWVRLAFRKSVEKLLLLAGIGVSLFFACGDPFIHLWTHGRLALVPWMSLSVTGIVVVNTLLRSGEYLLIGLNRHRAAAIAEIANGLIAMALVPAAIRSMGLGAVGAGSVLAALATSGWVVWREIGRRLGAHSFPAPGFVLRVAVGLVAATFCGSLVPRLITVPGNAGIFWRLIVGAAAGAAAFGGAASGLRILSLDGFFPPKAGPYDEAAASSAKP